MNPFRKIPEELSYFESVKSQWEKISPSVYEGRFNKHSLSIVEELLEKGQSEVTSGTLNPEFDWASDLAMARRWHASMKAWAESVNDQLGEGLRRWRDYATQILNFSREVGLVGIKFLLVAHGAVGLGCLAVIGQNADQAYLRYVATFGIVASTIGLTLVALGCVVLVEVGPQASNYVTDAGSKNFSFKRWRIMRKVIERTFDPWLKRGNYLIYGSIAWLIAYLLIATIALMFY